MYCNTASCGEVARYFSICELNAQRCCACALTVVWGARAVNGSFPEQTSVAYYAPDAVVVSWATGEQDFVVLAVSHACFPSPAIACVRGLW